jgi:phosphate transport system permease protein
LKKQLSSRIPGGVIQIILGLGVVVTILTTLLVMVILTVDTSHFFKEVSFAQFFLSTRWEPLVEPRTYGIWPLIAGTYLVAIGAMAFAVPMGILCAVFTTQYATDKVQITLKPILEILAGIPTVVYGYFALNFITPNLQKIFPNLQVFNALSAAIVVGVMILPMISSLTDDALRALPRHLKEGGYALGATSFELARDILLPAASGRIVAAVLLALSRAIGETMAVAMAAGSTPKLTANFFESIQTMTGYMVQVSLGDTEAGGVAYYSSFAVGALLFLMTMCMNTIGNAFIVRSYKDLG